MSKQKEKIIKLDINLLLPEKEIIEAYNKDKANYILEYGYEYTFWGKERKVPAIGEAEWNNIYPNGIKDWSLKNGNSILTSYGQQNIIDKINEVIDYLNKCQNKPKRK